MRKSSTRQNISGTALAAGPHAQRSIIIFAETPIGSHPLGNS